MLQASLVGASLPSESPGASLHLTIDQLQHIKRLAGEVAMTSMTHRKLRIDQPIMADNMADDVTVTLINHRKLRPS